MSHLLGPASYFSYSKTSHCSPGTQTPEALTEFSLDPKPSTFSFCLGSSTQKEPALSAYLTEPRPQVQPKCLRGFIIEVNANQWRMTGWMGQPSAL